MSALAKLSLQLGPSEYFKIPGRMDILASDPRLPISFIMDYSQLVCSGTKSNKVLIVLVEAGSLKGYSVNKIKGNTAPNGKRGGR